jgi:uncharacterized membrane-anchored protein
MKIPKSIWMVVFWILILAGFLFYQQAKLTRGHDIWVKPVPVDPRDLFRGDYVIFTYDFSQYVSSQGEAKGQTEVYAVLTKRENDYYDLNYFTMVKPDHPETIYIKGFAPEGLTEHATITYNIESYFVPEGEGKEYERYLGGELLVQIHISPDGEASIIKTNLKELQERGNT